jgi:hypothetical protein
MDSYGYSWAVHVRTGAGLFVALLLHNVRQREAPGCGLSGKTLKLRPHLKQHHDVARGRCSGLVP